MTSRFMNQVAIVTGAGQGLGRASALRLAEDGCDVLIVDIHQAQAETVAQQIRQLGRKAAIFIGDVGDHAVGQEIVEQALQELGDVHILVNNAGILRDSLLVKLTEANFDEVIRINLKGVFNCGQAFACTLIEKGHGGAMVNISSLAYEGNLGQTNYAAAKAGVVAMTRTWAMELARYGIRANAIAPGLMDTTMIANIPEKIKADLIHHIPLRRPGKPEELAATVSFLASEEASYITGHVVVLDGGASLGL